ncbi:MAG: hypothetical protein IJT43_10750 [Stomatobaculum sp.]|nr:hypothetical protein [Stomatobaculum sp.]
MCVVLAAACLAAGSSACGKVKKLDAPVESTASATEDALHNITRQEMAEKTGIDLPAPEGAENVSYHVLMASSETPVAEMDFTLDGHTAYLRAQATDWVPASPGMDAKVEELSSLMDTDHYDISGLYYKWTAMGTADIEGRSGMYCMDKDVGFVAWIDTAPGILYNLCMKKGAEQEVLMTLAEAAFVPLQGDAGTPAADSDWYMQVLNDAATKEKYPYHCFEDVNGDKVPELFLSTTEKDFISAEDKACMIIYEAGKPKIVKEIGKAGGDKFYFNADEHTVTWYHRLSGESHIEVYQLENGELKKITSADTYGPHHYPEKDNQEMLCFHDGKEVSKEETDALWEKYANEKDEISYTK